MPGTIWIDVEDLFDYVRHSPRPSGIQRLAYEIYRELRALRGESVRFLRHAVDQNSFVIVAWEQVEELFTRLAYAVPRQKRRAGALRPQSETLAAQTLASVQQPPSPLRVIRPVYLPIVALMPNSIRHPLASFVWFQAKSFEALGRCLAACFRTASGLVTGRRHRPSITTLHMQSAEPRPAPAEPIALRHEAANVWQFETAVQAGDTLLVLGSPWFKADYAEVLTAFAARGGRVGVLLYDIIPLRRPEWCDQALVRRFSDWFSSVLPCVDLLFAISEATSRDVRRYAATVGLSIPDRITVVPIGSGFGTSPAQEVDSLNGHEGAADVPLFASRYVLFVSTIEARKNHALMFRVWRRLLEELPEEDVPTLVFAGRVGWLVADLMQQLRNTDFLNGKIVVVDNATDTQIESLYRACLFTVFPSHYEGWGLPVTESLRFGKPCIIADNTSLPEAGGDLAKYFDSDDLDGAFRVICGTIRDAPALLAWQHRVAREFKAVPWSATAKTIIEVLDEPCSTRCKGLHARMSDAAAQSGEQVLSQSAK